MRALVAVALLAAALAAAAAVGVRALILPDPPLFDGLSLAALVLAALAARAAWPLIPR